MVCQLVLKIVTLHIANILAPDVTPRNIMLERTTPTIMLVSWTPLTLSEARGFVTFYTIAYTPVLNSRRRQVSQDTMYMNVSADSSSVTIVGLDDSLAYSVQVSAGTRVGQGVQSTAQVAGITEGERYNIECGVIIIINTVVRPDPPI